MVIQDGLDFVYLLEDVGSLFIGEELKVEIVPDSLHGGEHYFDGIFLASLLSDLNTKV
jgi:hypothetical protein